jgi:hypothetical protein
MLSCTTERLTDKGRETAAKVSSLERPLTNHSDAEKVESQDYILRSS